MSGFGSSLKFAREQRNLSIEQVAEVTRLSPTMVEMIEQEDFSMIPAPLYGRGFVKLFSQAVGLDPKPMIEQFMQLYDKENAPRRPQAPSSPISAEPPPVSAPIRMDAPRAPEPQPPPQPPKVIPPSRYAAPRPLDERPSLSTILFNLLHRVPSHIWRLTTLVVASVIMVCIIFFAVRALYRATTTEPVMAAEEAAVAQPETAAAEVVAPAAPVEPVCEAPAPTTSPRRGTVNEPLYVD